MLLYDIRILWAHRNVFFFFPVGSRISFGVLEHDRQGAVPTGRTLFRTRGGRGEQGYCEWKYWNIIMFLPRAFRPPLIYCARKTKFIVCLFWRFNVTKSNYHATSGNVQLLRSDNVSWYRTFVIISRSLNLCDQPSRTIRKTLSHAVPSELIRGLITTDWHLLKKKNTHRQNIH